jgi:hypothetical protein
MSLLRIRGWYLLLTIVYLATPATAVGQTGANTPSTMASTIMPSWQMIQRSFVSAAEAMPEDKWAFAPKDGTFKGRANVRRAGQARRVRQLCVLHGDRAEDPAGRMRKGGPDPARTKAESAKYLADSFTYAAEVLAKITPENALDAAGGRYGGQSTSLGLTTLAVWHASDHYGQIVVYLRMNNIVPPASQ